MKLGALIPFLLIFPFHALAAESDARAVHAEFSRCESSLERVKRDVSRCEEAVQRLRASPSAANSQEVTQEVSRLESRMENFRGRIARASAQANKIRDDLRNVKGPTCSSCLSSSVSLYCRAGEGLATDIEEYLSKASTLDGQLRDSADREIRKAAPTQPDTAFTARRERVGASIALNQAMLDSCGVEAAKTLWKQCRINLHAADSLHSTGNAGRSEQSLGLAELLLSKALQKCGSE